MGPSMRSPRCSSRVAVICIVAGIQGALARPAYTSGGAYTGLVRENEYSGQSQNSPASLVEALSERSLSQVAANDDLSLRERERERAAAGLPMNLFLLNSAVVHPTADKHGLAMRKEDTPERAMMVTADGSLFAEPVAQVASAGAKHGTGIAGASLIHRKVATGYQAVSVTPDGTMVSELEIGAPSSAASDLGMLEEVCKQPSSTDPSKWNAMKAMAGALNSVDAPYNIHGGTLLGLVRSCSIFDYDVDFVVEHDWLESNLDKTVSALLAAGFNPSTTFAQPDEIGYEAKFYHASLAQSDAVHLLKKHIQRRLARRGSTVHLQHREGITCDLFTIERKSDHYEWGLWIGVGQGERARCDTKSTGTVDFSWLGVNVKVPIPVEDALTSAYGTDYMEPHAWSWNVEPFTLGSCRREN